MSNIIMPEIIYQAHVRNKGWIRFNSNGEYAGYADDNSLPGIEALKIKVAGVYTGYLDMNTPRITYRAHVQNLNWQDWRSDGGIAGTTGQSLRLEAIEIKLVNINQDLNPGLSVVYRAQVQNQWQEWKRDGGTAGTTGRSLPIQAIQIRLTDARHPLPTP
ncbi:hypothetical protein ACFY5J_26975 [Peribacillus butanolivorans]|uniref:hypothetical protein n=1 Tax=Peribacillus butanolivorans TaxID=421767 RepID=UPI00366A4E43